MNSDPSSISPDPLLYFLLHSSLFVAVMAAVFGGLGLLFGWLTWGKFKRRCREVLAERDGFKGEIAALKRKVAEQAAKLSQAQPANGDSAPPASPILRSDPVIGSFIATASTLLSSHAAMPEPARRLGLPEHIHPVETNADTTPEADDAATEPPEAALPSEAPKGEIKPKPEVRPLRSVLRSVIHPHRHQHHATAPESESAESPPTPEEATRRPVEAGRPPASSPNGSTIQGKPDEGYDPQFGIVYLTAPEQTDDLTHLKGVASVIEGRLNEVGVYTYRQIALWSDENIREISSQLAFKDRILRENWRDQARELHFQKYGERL